MGLGRVKKVWGKMAARIAGLTAAAAAIALALGPARAAQPSLTPAQVVALFGAAGFPRGPNKRPVNRRRQPANPKVSFVDMNGDGQLEALFIDEGPYYKPDGRWYAVAAQSPGGAWRILEGEGSLHATGAASRGWFVLAATGAGRTKELRYDGHVYASADHAPGAAPAPADRAQDGDVAPAADAEAAPRGGRYPTDGWKAPVKFAQLSPAEQASIMTAAGYRRVGKAWKGCEGSSSVDKDGVEIRDLNGDGRPEAVITASGYECYGNAGQGFAVLRAVPGGWKTMAEETGIPTSLNERGARGYPDIEIGGPGVCFPVERWNGKSYRVGGGRTDDDEGKPCKI